MKLNKHLNLFNTIAPIYRLFFSSQRRDFKFFLLKNKKLLTIPDHGSVLDIGCGTGALTSCFSDLQYDVTGVDGAPRMIQQAKKAAGFDTVNFQVGDVLAGLPFSDKTFDLVIASFVAHGFKADDRKKLYSEASRLAKQQIIFHDFNSHRSFFIDFVERLEGSDYFNFIKNADNEMRAVFGDIQQIDVAPNISWYICKP